MLHASAADQKEQRESVGVFAKVCPSGEGKRRGVDLTGHGVAPTIDRENNRRGKKRKRG